MMWVLELLDTNLMCLWMLRVSIQKKQKLERQLTPADLICAEPWYKTVKPLHLWEDSSIDIVLISNPMGLLGLPFLIQNPRFCAKIYMTEATAKIGQLMMEDLVSMQSEFRCFGTREFQFS